MPSGGKHIRLVTSPARWDPEDRDAAACYGLSEMFDLASREDGLTNSEIRSVNKYKIKNARRICATCPVFNLCLQDLLYYRPTGVIMCGVPLSNMNSVTERKLLDLHSQVSA